MKEWGHGVPSVGLIEVTTRWPAASIERPWGTLGRHMDRSEVVFAMEVTALFDARMLQRAPVLGNRLPTSLVLLSPLVYLYEFQVLSPCAAHCIYPGED